MSRNRQEPGDTALLDEWTDRYAELRAGGPGHISAWLGIPLVVSSLIGILWSLPVPEVISEISPAINAATMFLMASFVYYCILSISLAIGGLAFLMLAAMPYVWIVNAGYSPMPIAASLFVVSLCWHLLQTKRATGKLSFARNLQYLMLGPLWLLRAAYRRLGLAY